MVGLLDIADLDPQTVEVRGTTLNVTGITFAQLAAIMSTFPQIARVLAAEERLDATLILSLGPDVVAFICTIATGTPVTNEALAKAKSLLPGEQLAIMTKAIELTFTEEMRPFVAKVQAYLEDRMRAAGSGASAEDGKDQATNLQRRSKDSLRSATTGAMFGSLLPDKPTAIPN